MNVKINESLKLWTRRGYLTSALLSLACRYYATLSHTRFAKAKLVLPRPEISEKKLVKRFMDVVTVTCKAGNGGNGCISLSSQAYKEWAGPDGGNGGNGGHVIAVANSNYSSLSHIRSVVFAKSGEKGRTACQDGKNAQHVMIPVPIGTMVRNWETREVLAELTNPEQKYLLARGGAGGHGNYFYLSNEVRAPVFAEEGGKGEEKKLILEMRVMATFGLIGFPNAGKSTLLRALTRAKPKVADYPFTTLNAHIGMIRYPDDVQVSIADVPGLIKGSHQNRGLGISFLRHIEKCRCLLYVIDISQDSPWKQLEDLQYELHQYSAELTDRPHVVLANKMDTENAETQLAKLKANVKSHIIPISGKEGINMNSLREQLRQLHDLHTS